MESRLPFRWSERPLARALGARLQETRLDAGSRPAHPTWRILGSGNLVEFASNGFP